MSIGDVSTVHLLGPGGTSRGEKTKALGRLPFEIVRVEALETGGYNMGL